MGVGYSGQFRIERIHAVADRLSQSAILKNAKTSMFLLLRYIHPYIIYEYIAIPTVRLELNDWCRVRTRNTTVVIKCGALQERTHENCDRQIRCVKIGTDITKIVRDGTGIN